MLISEFIEWAKKSVFNGMNVKEIQLLLAAMGYNVEKMEVGSTLVSETEELQRKQILEYSE